MEKGLLFLLVSLLSLAKVTDANNNNDQKNNTSSTSSNNDREIVIIIVLILFSDNRGSGSGRRDIVTSKLGEGGG